MTRSTPPKKEEEIWLIIPSFPSYEISSLGRIRTRWRRGKWKKGHLLKQWKHCRNGWATYRRVCLLRAGKKWWRLVHRLVLESFVGPAPTENSVGRHLDDDRENNTLGNLAWGTTQENAWDREKNKLEKAPF